MGIKEDADLFRIRSQWKMDKMLCQCGKAISDVVYPCPTEGTIIGQEDYEVLCRTFVEQTNSFFDAVQQSQRAEWLDEHFGNEYPQKTKNGDVVPDIFNLHMAPRSLCIADCKNCGRLWIQTSPGKNEYRSFLPDNTGYSRVLALKGNTAADE